MLSVRPCEVQMAIHQTLVLEARHSIALPVHV
jgi:hypothetical protein